MNIKRCDRCGEEIRYNGNWLDALGEAVEHLGNALTGKPNIKLFNTNNGEEVDLCPACRTSLQKWMKEKKPEMHPEEDPTKTKKAYIIPEDAVKFGKF